MSDHAHDIALTADEQARLAAAHAALSRQAGTYARVPMGEAFDVLCNELDDILNRVCGIEEVSLAYQWMYSWKVPDRLGGEGAVGQAAVSGSATTNREPERAPSPPSLARGQSATVPEARQPRSVPSPRRWCTRCGGEYNGSSVHGPDYCGLVGEPPSPTGTDSPEGTTGEGTTGESRKHSGGSPTRHLAAVPKEAK